MTEEYACTRCGAQVKGGEKLTCSRGPCPMALVKPRISSFPMLDSLTLGDLDGDWQEIDAGDHRVAHFGIAKVVVEMDEGYPVPAGVELARRITAMPAMIDALWQIYRSESIYEAQTAARDALEKAGLL